jgi:hypothetical protein
MRVRSWWERLGKRRDEAALERAEQMKVESAEEQHVSAGDIEEMQVDERTARFAGEADIDEAKRLGDGE